MQQQSQRIVIPQGNQYNFIYLDQIIRIEADGSYSKFYLADGTKIVSCKSLGYYTEALAKCGFYITHKSHMVNTTFIDCYKKEGTIIMSNGSRVPVSRRRKEDFVSSVIHAIDPRCAVPQKKLRYLNLEQKGLRAGIG